MTDTHGDKEQRLYAALLKLVECKDLIDCLDGDLAKPERDRVLTAAQREEQNTEYRRRKPLAWANARAALIECVPVTRSAGTASTEEARYTLGDLDTFCQLAASAAIQCALQAIEDEPEVPGEMPDEMWATINGDRDACTNAIRIAVKQTKKGIEERLLASEPAKQTPRSASEESITLADIREQIDHIEQNGFDLKKYGGQDADEGRCRELCALFLRDFINAHEMQKKIDEWDKATHSPADRKANP